MSSALGENPETVKLLLYSLRASGVIRDVRGYKRSLHCQVDPKAAKRAADLLYEVIS